MNIALIRELNADHAVLMRAVDAIHTAGGYSNDVRDLLIKVRSALVRHLDKEEQHFYPVMREAAEKNMDLNNLLTVMGLEMEQIANKALGLIEGWLEKDGGDAFTDEFDSFRTILIISARRNPVFKVSQAGGQLKSAGQTVRNQSR